MAALRKHGASVEILSMVGHGCPDIIAGWQCANVFLEIKDGAKVPSAQKLTADQVEWHRRWKGPLYVVNSVEQAIAVLARVGYQSKILPESERR